MNKYIKLLSIPNKYINNNNMSKKYSNCINIKNYLLFNKSFSTFKYNYQNIIQQNNINNNIFSMFTDGKYNIIFKFYLSLILNNNIN